MKRVPFLLAALLLAAVPSDQRAIETQIQRWLDGFNAGDLAPINAVFSDSLVYMVPGVNGGLTKAQIAANLQTEFTKYKTHIDGITDEIGVSGDMAFDRGHFTITLTPRAGGAAITQAGKFLETWKKESDGQWRVTRLATINDP